MRATRSSLEDLFSEHGEHLPLGRAAALISAEEQPGSDPAATLRALDRLAAGVRMPPQVEPVEAIARLNVHLFDELGFAGDEDDYDDPRNSLLDQVIERRRGLPILLSVVYIEVAQRRGIAVDPIGYPSHFLVSPRDTEPRFFVDPFHGGRILREDVLRERLIELGDEGDDEALDQHLAAVTGRQVVVRILTNLWGSYKRRGDAPGVLRCLERLEVLETPGTPEAMRVAYELARVRRL